MTSLSLRKHWPRFARDSSGSTLIFTAVILSGLLGLAGLAIDVAYWQVVQRNMQGAAEQAAFSAAVAAQGGASTSLAATQAKGITAQAGFTDGQSNVTVAVNNPPTQGGYTTNNSAFEVVITQPQPRWLSALYLSTSPTVSARAVALEGATPDYCVLALATTGSSTMSIGGNDTMNLSCGLGVNSSTTGALSLGGNSSLTATDINLVASNYSKSGGSTLTASTLNTSQTAITDPYASRTIPSYGACNATGYNPPASTSISASGGTYVFCNGVTINSGVTLTLTNGTFIIDGGILSVSSSGGLTTSNATIVLTGGTNGQTCCATVSIAGGAHISMTAPTSGTMSGLAIFQDRATPSTSGSTVGGGSSQLISGALYFPNTTLTYTGNSSVSSTGKCTQLIAAKLSFTGTSTVHIQCGGVGTTAIGTTVVSQILE